VDSIEGGLTLDRAAAKSDHAAHSQDGHAVRRSHTIMVRLDEFGLDALIEESDRLGVSSEELASFSVLYYLADLDSGRIARRLPPRSADSD